MSTADVTVFGRELWDGRVQKLDGAVFGFYDTNWGRGRVRWETEGAGMMNTTSWANVVSW